MTQVEAGQMVLFPAAYKLTEKDALVCLSDDKEKLFAEGSIGLLVAVGQGLLESGD